MAVTLGDLEKRVDTLEAQVVVLKRAIEALVKETHADYEDVVMLAEQAAQDNSNITIPEGAISEVADILREF